MGYRDIPIDTVKCPGCEVALPRETEICPACGSPVAIERYAELELKLKPDLRKARRFLGVVAALDAFSVLVAVATGHRADVAVFSFVFFGVCFLVAFKRPLGASIAAMSLFLFDEAAEIGLGRAHLVFQGLIFKVILVVLLGSAIRSGYRARDLRGQWRRRDRTIGIAVLVGSAVLGLALGLMRG